MNVRISNFEMDTGKNKVTIYEHHNDDDDDSKLTQKNKRMRQISAEGI